MSKYGRMKAAVFEDGVILVAERTCVLRRSVRVRREIEGYYGRVWFCCPSEFKLSLL